MMLVIMIGYGSGIQGQHVHRAKEDEWGLFTVSKMAIVYGSGQTGWDLFATIWRLDIGLVDWWTGEPMGKEEKKIMQDPTVDNCFRS